MKTDRIVFGVLFLFASLTFMVRSAVGHGEAAEKMTPLLLAVQDAPVPFMGSDGQIHLVYELGMTNFSSAEIAVEKVEVVGDGPFAILLVHCEQARFAQRIVPGRDLQPGDVVDRSPRNLEFVGPAS